MHGRGRTGATNSHNDQDASNFHVAYAHLNSNSWLNSSSYESVPPLTSHSLAQSASAGESAATHNNNNSSMINYHQRYQQQQHNSDYNKYTHTNVPTPTPLGVSDFASVDHELLAFVRRCLALSIPPASVSAVAAATNTASSTPAYTINKINKESDAMLSGSGKMDDNFDQYAFVRNIRSRVDKLVAPILAEHMRSLAATTTASGANNAAPVAGPSTSATDASITTSKHDACVGLAVPSDNLVPSVVDRVLASPEYGALVQHTLIDARRSVASLIEHLKHRMPFDDAGNSSGSAGQRASASHDRPSSQELSFSALSSATCESSSMGSISSGACPGTDELKHMFARMHPSQPFEVRLGAAQLLSAFSVGDMLADEFWPDARRVMELALGDTDTRIASTALKIFARAFHTAPPHMAPEVYLAFVSHLVHVFENTLLAKTVHGLDTRDPSVDLFLKKIRLLDQFMIHIPSLWFRFPDQILKDVMGLTFRLMRSPRNHAGAITLLHYLAVVDPRAAWFEKWMMSSLGRTQVVTAMEKSDAFMDLAVAFVGHVAATSTVSGVDGDTDVVSGTMASRRTSSGGVGVEHAVNLKGAGNSNSSGMGFVRGSSRHGAPATATDDLLVEDVDPNDDSDTTHLIVKADLDHTHFLHVTVMLARLCTTACGRHHFPIAIHDASVISSLPSSLAALFLVADMESILGTPKYELSSRSLIMLLIQKMTSRATLANASSFVRYDGNGSGVNSGGGGGLASTGSVSGGSVSSSVPGIGSNKTATYASRHLHQNDARMDTVDVATTVTAGAPVANTALPGPDRDRDRDLPESLNMSRFMARILKSISSSETLCHEQLYKDDILNELVRPIQLIINGRPLTHADEGGLLAIAETLSNIASTDTGRKFILRGESRRGRSGYHEAGSDGVDTQRRQLHRHRQLRLVRSGDGSRGNEVLDTIAMFVKHLLGGETMRVSGAASSTSNAIGTAAAATSPSSVSRNNAASSSAALIRRVSSGFVFFLRQLYRSCEGLLWLQCHDLHATLSRLLFCTADADAAADRDWTATLIDNLLNFAATPKGVMLLQHTGAMQPCVAYMFQRYQKKLKVSKCEKFGYGTLVSQISTTRTGTEALWKTGLVQSFLRDVWCLLCGDDRPGVASSLPDIDDHRFAKAMYNIVKIFLSFPALETCLKLEYAQMVDQGHERDRQRGVGNSGNNTTQTGRHASTQSSRPPQDGQPIQPFPRDTFSYLIQKLVLVDQEIDDNWLVSYEESHQVGLRILRLVLSSLDSLILVETRFNVQESLMRLQIDAHMWPVRVSGHHAPVFIVDANSLLRNHVLVSSVCVGGPGERVLPPTMIPMRCDGVDVPVFDGVTVPVSVMPVIDRRVFVQTSSPACGKLVRLLDRGCGVNALSSLSSAACVQWVAQLQSVFGDVLGQKDGGDLGSGTRTVPFPICRQLLGVLPDALSKLTSDTRDSLGWCVVGNASDPSQAHITASTSPSDKPFSPAHRLGISIASRYAARFLSLDHSTIKSGLETLLRRTRTMDKPTSEPNDRRGTQITEKDSNDVAFAGFDWFAATLFIMCQADVDTITDFLTVFRHHMSSLFLWARRHASYPDSHHSDMSSVSPLASHDGDASHLLGLVSCHLVEAILEDELPMVSSAFTLSGCTPTQMCQRWFRECYWNVLPFTEIANAILTCLIYGIDYQVYFAIALIRHMREQILVATRDGVLVDLICGMAPVCGDGDGKNGDGSGFGGDFASGFATVECLEYMHTLRDRHREMVLLEMRQATGYLSNGAIDGSVSGDDGEFGTKDH